jgi:NAD dependent epimerase/dehydratase family enzyme
MNADGAIVENSGSFFEGPINLAAPGVVTTTNAAFLQSLAEARGRWYAVVPVPELGLRSALGQSASVVLDSQRLVPSKMIAARFMFTYPDLSLALASL